MSRHVNFRNHVNAITCRHNLEITELLFRIRTIFGCQPREALAFQTKSRIRLVPVIPKEFHKTIVIQMYLQLIQLIERKNFDIITQVVHRKEFTSHINHESSVGIQRKVRSPSFHQSLRLVMNHLEQRTRSPENTFRSRCLNSNLTLNIHPVSFFTQSFVRLTQSQINSSFFFLSYYDTILPTKHFLQILHQDFSLSFQFIFFIRRNNHFSSFRKYQFSFCRFPLLQGRNHLWHILAYSHHQSTQPHHTT